jgi:molybdate transport system ATP-binding protein
MSVLAFTLSAVYPRFTLAARAAWDAPATALFGASGSGKSSIVEALAGLRPEIVGEATLAGRRVDGLRPEERRVGWVPQEAALFPHLSVRGNLEFARSARGRSAAQATRAAADRAVDVLEIGPLLDRPAGALSGGERQRVAIARALASAPDVLLLDEPLASVDRPLRARIVPFLARLPEATGVPMLLVTHDPHEVLALASHVVVLEAGRVVAQGHPREVLASAAALGALEALGAENLFEVEVMRRATGMLTLRTERGCQLEMAAVAGFPEPARVAVRAEDILLATDRPRRISAQNVLDGAVTSLDALGEHVYVRILSGGESWVAKVTARAVATLELQPGRPVHMLIKAHSVHAQP